MAGLDLAERDCRDRRVECDNWANEWGSDEIKEARGRVESLLRYLGVTASWALGNGRGDAGVSKYGTSNSYNGSSGSAILMDKTVN